MTQPADDPRKPKKRTQFGKRHNGFKRITAEEQKRKVAAYLNMLDIATGKK